MKVRITGCAPDYGKVGDVIEVDGVTGSALVCRGAASVVEHDKPGKGAGRGVVADHKMHREPKLAEPQEVRIVE